MNYRARLLEEQARDAPKGAPPVTDKTDKSPAIGLEGASVSYGSAEGGPFPTLAQIAELDSLIVRYGELARVPPADVQADLETRRRMAPVEVLPQLTEWRAMVRAEEVRQ